MKHITASAFLCLAFCFSGCTYTKNLSGKISTWWTGGGKSKVEATAALIAQDAKAIAEQDVFSNAQSVEDSIIKQQNVQGFSEAFRTLEAQLPAIGISAIPSFVSDLRKIWLPPQQHYTQMAADLGTTIENRITQLQKKTGKPLQSAQTTQIIEGVIQGLSTAQPVPPTP